MDGAGGGQRGGYRGARGRGGEGGHGGGRGRGRGGRGRGGRGREDGGRGGWRREHRNEAGGGRQDGHDGGEGAQTDGARNNQTRGPREVWPVGYKTLEQLLGKDPDEAAIELGSLKQGLRKLLESGNIRYDVVSLVFQVYHHVCQAQLSTETVNMLVDMLGRTNFISRKLTPHLIGMRTENDRNRQRTMPRCIQDIAKVLSEMQQRFPSHGSDIAVAATLLEDVVRYAEARKIVVDDTIKEEVRQLNKLHKTIDQEREKKQHTHVDPTGPPPDDYRELSVFPTTQELTESTNTLYLRANVKKGKYESVDHYLDVQFRLLREDFVHPLREGIGEYKRATARPGRNKKFQDIRLYYDVTLEEPLYSQSGVTFRIHFDETKLKGIRWQSSKRLIFGSLVILSPDDFKTLIFGTVANRKPEELVKGFIEIKLERDEEIAEIFSDKTFIMAESSSYFEAYRHVLSRLQLVTEQSMPLTDYIISASSTVQPPRYLRNNRASEYDLSPIVSDDVPNASRTKMLLQNVKILVQREWNRLGNTGLDDTQLHAVQAALTQEMTVIQGPPGTGKTYIGLKIVHTLLKNKHLWSEAADLVLEGPRRRSNKPILLVCYTNHALDQFLEGVAEYNSEGIVRVGGRSASEALKRFNLNTLRSSKLREEIPRHLRRRIGEVRGEIEAHGREVKTLQEKINKTRKGLLHEKVLKDYMTDNQFDSLTLGNIPSRTGSSLLVQWLLQDMQLEFLDGDPEPAGPAENEGQNDNENVDEHEALDILEEADLLEEMRRLDVDDPRNRMILGDGDDFDDGTVAFRVNDLDNLQQEGGWQQDRRNQRHRKREFERKLRSTERMSDEEARGIINRNVWAIRESRNRWRLYRYWISLYRRESNRRLVAMQRQFTTVCQELREARSQEDFEILRHAVVIGLTTTGAAKFHTLLQRIQPRIVIVEEAAEVLEAHIVTALTESCQHLVLIGDHQQLRPNPTVYKLAKNYHLDISLFERMINNDVPYQQLNLQHRMRPEISQIMRMKGLYPGLRDHDSVKVFEDIRGVMTNIYFIHHTMEEDSVDEMKSHSNVHEAKFLVKLCQYFLQQGYLPEQITILTTYAGQLFAFKNRMKKIDFQGVRVATVDNFQGEENDIILLSLVRSNKEGSAGFLKIDNRICVALSRARKGLYCIGNFTLLSQQNPSGPSLWRDIVKHSQATKTIGTSLTLQCENHPATLTKVASDQDFAKVPEGGCSLPCEARLSCGHVCKMPCHPTDKNHENYKCLQNCTTVICTAGHRCMKRCWEKCDKQCTKPVKKTLPCGHEQLVSCYKSVSQVVCISPCRKRLECGHPCQETCGRQCTVTCDEEILRSDWPCGHNVRVKCAAGPEACPAPCNTTLSCEHKCKGTCGTCYRGRLHAFCRMKCGRSLVCGHPCQSTCAADCPPCMRNCQNRCQHSKCKKRCGEPCAPCAERCMWRCEHQRCGRECGQPCDRGPCNAPCRRQLACGHPCIGLCGEPCPKKCRVCHREEITEILFGDEDEPDARFVELEDCKHVIEFKALDHWMNTDSGTQDTVTIQLKVCPRCKTPIRRNLRYSNIIKQALSDIERAKRVIFGKKQDIEIQRRLLVQNLTREVETMDMLAIGQEEKMFSCKQDARRFYELVISTSALSSGQVTAMANRVTFLKELRDLKKTLRLIRISTKEKGIAALVTKDVAFIRKWLCQEPINRMSQQQADDANREAKRLNLALSLLRLLSEKPAAYDKAPNEVKDAKLALFDEKVMTNKREEEIRSLLKAISQKSGGLGISEKERKDIVAAIGLTQGHWYKCPNGHVYAIGECGGATQESKCPECGSNIGGTGHRLTEGNRVASEMDGARFAAWSEEANDMHNFNFEF